MADKTATLRNLLTGKTVRVKSVTEHPCSSYGAAVWVDKDGNCYGQVGLPLFGYEFIGS